MPFIKITNSGYKSPEDMMKLIDYIISDERHETNGMTGGCMILTGSSQNIYDQMMDVKNYYNKANGRFMRHIIVSMSDTESKNIDVNSLYHIALRICNLFSGFQTLFAIHQETGRPHIHIAINTVSFMDGRKIQIRLSKLKSDIQKIFVEYNISSSIDDLIPQYTATTFDLLQD